MRINSIQQNQNFANNTFNGQVKSTPILKKAIMEAPTADLEKFYKTLKNMKKMDDKTFYTLEKVNSKIFACINKPGFRNLEELFVKLSATATKEPPARDSIQFLKVVERDANGNFIDENKKIINNTNDVFACGMRKLGYIPEWNDFSSCYEPRIDSNKNPLYIQEKVSIDKALNRFTKNISATYPATEEAETFKSREDVLSAIEKIID